MNSELEWYRKAKNSKEAIFRAGASVNDQGKIYSHQSRMGSEYMAEVGKLLVLRTKDFKKAKTFQDLMDLIKSMEIHRVGPLTTYDIALSYGS